MTQTRQKSSFEPIRLSLNKTLGEIILDVTGNPFVQQFYAAKPPVNGPAGQVAENLGAVDHEVKTALLLAQAAERVLVLAEQTDSLFSRHRHRHGFNRASSGALAADDPIFQYAGSPEDPENLRMAQANWQLAQIYLNLEQGAKAAGQGRLFSPAYIGAFKKQARGSFEQAAEMLDQKGYADAAFHLRLTAQRYGPAAAVPETPHVFAERLRDDEEMTPEIRKIAGRLAQITQKQGGAESITLRPGYNMHSAPV